MAEAIAKLNNADTKKAIAESCGKELAPLAEIYLLSLVLTKVGYDASINQKIMSKIFPGLKTPKALGRTGKSKKEDE